MAEGGGASAWEGEGVRLRAVEPDDWALFHVWNQDDETARALYWVPFPQSRDAARRWAEREATREPDGDAFRWIIEDCDGAAVGSISAHDCDRRAGAFGYGVHVAEPYRRRGHAAAAILLVLRHYFGELRYQKAHVHVYAFNAASAALHERLGFQLEGRLRRMVFSQGRRHDVLAYGLTVEEFAERHGPRLGWEAAETPRGAAADEPADRTGRKSG